MHKNFIFFFSFALDVYVPDIKFRKGWYLYVNCHPANVDASFKAIVADNALPNILHSAICYSVQYIENITYDLE